MLLLRAIRSMMPKEERVIEQFIEQARHIVDAAAALEAVMQAGPEERADRTATLKRIEKDADRVAKDAGRGLHRAFITPFDRSEIQALINALDDCIDLMDEVPGLAALYGIETFDDRMMRMAAIGRKQAALLSEVMPLLTKISVHADRILHICGQISDLEDEADEILRDAMKSLIAERPEMIDFLGRREVYELLEAVTDRCDDVGDLIEGITLDQA
ncbi:hypothetical protein FBZ83_11481 [Azospirillum brasilense]|uniref:DUF47 domain-containing protein n=1 Tax=Azospirillum brasilense TaxID=192 RepID=A0A560BYQ2_AZOBR|nr:DUF47 family protein [Azospirillum brasilense]MBK3734939.1 DUF47 family protein [Azospirillum brasilense]TWA77750.1 hypothetical protein FBZ83_11481 [Azospirillum brasilense]